jgi:hypothetical protein
MIQHWEVVAVMLLLIIIIGLEFKVGDWDDYND